jgi:hypothetical protein
MPKAETVPAWTLVAYTNWSFGATARRNGLYVVNKVDNNISAFSVNAATGLLSPVSGSPFPSGGNGPVGIIIVPKP